jgi:PIN domain nuclease of toxin-antitoxin system
LTAYLLDTHALIWWMSANPRLPAKAAVTIAAPNSTIYASAANAFEIALKYRLGKLPIAAPILDNYEVDLASVGISELPISTRHALAAGDLSIDHGDPFDRLLIAQAKVEDLTLISNEQIFDRFGVKRLWD